MGYQRHPPRIQEWSSLLADMISQIPDMSQQAEFHFFSYSEIFGDKNRVQIACTMSTGKERPLPVIRSNPVLLAILE
jgi:hypothetical protein